MSGSPARRAPRQTSHAWRAALAAVAGLSALGACDSRTPQPRGLGPYRFGVTTRAQLTQGVCQPTELTDGRKATWCFALPPIKVGKRVAEIDAYFLGTDPPLLEANATDEQRAERRKQLESQPLIELQLKVRGCEENEVDQWMRERFGPALPDSTGNRVFWKNDFLWAVAFLPSEPGRCHVHLLPLSEADEIARLKLK
jgi:hypothetical protein